MAAADGVEKLLKEAKLENLLHKFIEEKIDINVLCEASDADYTRLGVVRISGRITIRDLARKTKSHTQSSAQQPPPSAPASNAVASTPQIISATTTHGMSSRTM